MILLPTHAGTVQVALLVKTRNLSADMARAYVDGFQTSTGEKEITDGWGYNSVNAMVKHWPGGGSGEAEEMHIMVLENLQCIPAIILQQHFIPFTEGAFKLKWQNKNGFCSDALLYHHLITRIKRIMKMLRTIIMPISSMICLEKNINMMVWFVPIGW